MEQNAVRHTYVVCAYKESPYLEKCIESLKKQTVESRILVATSTPNELISGICEKYDLPCITRAKKPGTRGIRECLEQFEIPAEEAALVGDQIFTDTLGANSAGVTPILVRAIDNHNIWLKLRHVAEMPFIFASRKRRLRK